MNNTNYVIGYIRDKGLSSMEKKDALKFTHLNIAFGKINDGELYTNIQNFDQISRIKSLNPNIKFLLSLGGWGNGGFSLASRTKESREKLINSAIKLLIKHDLDGLDIDWEYPCISVAGIDSSKDDKENYTLLLKDFREALDIQEKKFNKKYLLTVAVGADEYFTASTNMAEAQKYLDYVMIMTYDLRGGFQVLTGHHTNLYPSTGDLFRSSVHTSVELFNKAGVPKEKIIIGIAFYSRMWKNVSNLNNGLHQIAETVGMCGPDYTDILQNYLNKNGYTRFWDEEAKAPYLFNGENFISYEDSESITHKCNYVKDNNLLGAMFWQYEYDQTGQLLDAIYNNLD